MQLKPLILIVLLFLFTIATELTAQSPYKTNVGKEISLWGSGAGLSIFGLYLNSKIEPLGIEEIRQHRREAVNPFDRLAINNWSPKTAKASDALLVGAMLMPMTLFLSKKIRADWGNALVLYGETLLFNVAINKTVKALFMRSRPYVYNPDVPLPIKQEREARRSFYSGHASAAFASAIFFAKLYNDYFPKSKYKGLVWSCAVLQASLTAYLRFKAGQHFASDVMVGALVGGALGFVIPTIHRKNMQIRHEPSTDFMIRFSLPLH